MIDLEDISYSYSGIPALKNIHLHIVDGESVVFMGANGSGKSTLLKVINGILFPDSGVYRFNDETVTKKKLQEPKFSKSFHQKIGFVFQNSDTQLFCSDVYEEIAFGPRQMGMPEEDIDKRIKGCLDLLGISEFAHRTPYHLSGGEKRKVTIACVLAMNPDVLVLDEPMNGLDPRTQRWLVEFLINLNKAGKTLITSTHNLELVQEISQRAILFDENHTIAADLPTEQLLMNVELLKDTNLVDEYYHQHADNHHTHFHMHPFLP